MDKNNILTEVCESPGKGKGIFAVKKIPEGQKLITQKPTVLGPKQTSPFVCVECLDYINEQSGKIINSLAGKIYLIDINTEFENSITVTSKLL